MEENRRISWSDLFIKGILVIIFVLFTVWLLSLSNKNLSNSLNVLTDDIFSQNIEKMKQVGKEYFTTSRLPKKIGEVKTLTLKEMYEKKLILELKDKYGNSCDKEDSYVSIEKFDNEYQMKVNLECDSNEEYIIVIMGCYDYCDTDICELKDELKQIEYEYKKSTGGTWSDYGKWSEWSKVSVSKTDYRQVETKKENEKYSYDKVITEKVYEKLEDICPEGYEKTSDGTKCYKGTNKNEYSEPTCPNISGYAVTRNGFTCNYSKSGVDVKTATATCPSGYSKSGNTCVKSSSTTAEPLCPTVSGYTYTGRNGFTCNYSRTVTSSSYTLSYVTTKTGSYVPGNTSTYVYEEVGYPKVEFSCDDGCKMVYIHTYKVYKKNYGTSTEKITKDGFCPSGYTKSENSCIKTTSTNIEPICPTVSGYTYTGRENFTCNYSKNIVDTKTDVAVCPKGYSKTGNSCSKNVSDIEYEEIVKICPSDYKKTDDGTKCYKEVDSTIKVEGTKEVTYYRYRVREYKGGSVDYKWSTSKEDKKLLDAGYKLTGRTR